MHSRPSVLWWALYSVSWAILDFTLGNHSLKWAAETKANIEDAGKLCSTEGHLFSGSQKKKKWEREGKKDEREGGRGKKEGNLTERFSVVKTTSPFSWVATACLREPLRARRGPGSWDIAVNKAEGLSLHGIHILLKVE